MNKKVVKRLKGMTLVELAVAMLATSILAGSLTAFLVFFSNLSKKEEINHANFDSANNLKFAITQMVDKFNYTYDKSTDFEVDGNNKVRDLNKIFVVENFDSATASDPDEPELVGKSTYYYKKEEKDGAETGNYVFGYTYKDEKDTESVPVDYPVYTTLSKMELSISRVKNYESENKAYYKFTIDFNYGVTQEEDKEKDIEKQEGYTEHLTFYRFIYFAD